MPEMVEKSAAEALVGALVAEEVDATFGIPGVHNLLLYDALADRPEIRRVTPRHEDGGAMMANGYARASGRPGVCIGAAGPGVTNMVTGLATAYADSVPLLVLAAQLSRKVMGREMGELHDIADLRGILDVVSGSTASVQDPQDAASAVHAAMAQLRTSRPRPISIEIPVDVLGQKAPVHPARPLRVARLAADSRAVERAAQVLERAENPVILAGGGAVGAASGVIELAERLAAPVLTTSMGLGIIPDDHPLSLGTGFDLEDSFLAALAAADVVLAVGTRFTSYVTRNGKLRLSGKLIHVDVDAKEFGKLFPVEEALLGQAESVVPQLLDALSVDRRGQPSYARDLRPDKVAHRQQLEEHFPVELGLAQAVRSAAPRDAILALDMTGLAYWIRRVGIAYAPRTILYPLAYGCLGFGVPCAIGAQVAQPSRKVVAICGDAGFQFTVQELATAVQLGQAFPIVLVNDQGYSALRPRQKRLFGRTVDADLCNPDFVKLAQAYGADAERVAPDDLGEALGRALQSDRMTLLEVPVELRHPEALASIQARAAAPVGAR